MRTFFGVGLLASVLLAMTCCATTGGKQAAGASGLRPTGDRPLVLLEIFMDTRPFQERQGRSGSSLTVETTDSDFPAKPHERVDQALKASIPRQGITVLDRGAGRAPLILSGEIRHFYGQIQMTRLPGKKEATTSSFLPANFHATVQVLATLFDVEHQRVIFRKSFLATRDERHSMSESKPQEAKRELVGLVEQCLTEVASAVAEDTASHIRSTEQQPGPAP